MQEISSGLAILCIAPGAIAICYFRPIQVTRWKLLLVTHLCGWLIFSITHLLLMGLFRAFLYPLSGLPYDFASGDFWVEFIYEARKDLLVYVLIITLTYAYVFILDRLQGEANFVSEATAPEFEEQFLVKMLQKEYLVKVEDIQWIESARNYVLLHCQDQSGPSRAYPMRATMQSLEQRLDPRRFARCHRTAMVRLGAIATLHQSPEHLIELNDGSHVPFSKTYFSRLKSTLTST